MDMLRRRAGKQKAGARTPPLIYVNTHKVIANAFTGANDHLEATAAGRARPVEQLVDELGDNCLLIVDEAHKANPTLMAVLMLMPRTARIVLLTATPAAKQQIADAPRGIGTLGVLLYGLMYPNEREHLGLAQGIVPRRGEANALLQALRTDAVAEGAAHLYFTARRVVEAVRAAVSTGDVAPTAERPYATDGAVRDAARRALAVGDLRGAEALAARHELPASTVDLPEGDRADRRYHTPERVAEALRRATVRASQVEEEQGRRFVSLEAVAAVGLTTDAVAPTPGRRYLTPEALGELTADALPGGVRNRYLTLDALRDALRGVSADDVPRRPLAREDVLGLLTLDDLGGPLTTARVEEAGDRRYFTRARWEEAVRGLSADAIAVVIHPLPWRAGRS